MKQNRSDWRKELATLYCFFISFCNFSLGQEAKLMLPIGHTNQVHYAQFSPDGKKVITASYDGSAKLWDAISGSLLLDLKAHTKYVWTAQFCPDGKKIVTASFDGNAEIWDANTGNVLFKLKGHTNQVWSAQFSPDGKKIVTASRDSTSRIWNAVTGEQLLVLKGHTSYVSSASFSPDGKNIVTASYDGTAKVWDATSGDSLLNLKGHHHEVYFAQFSPDGKKIVTASGDSTAKIWDAASGKLLFSLIGHNGQVWTAEFSHDGKKVTTASSDSTAKIWDATSGNPLIKCKGHTDNVLLSQFSPDDKKLLTASYDNSAKIWDAANGSLLFDLKGHSSTIWFAAFSPDGKKIVTASRDKTAKIWNTSNGNLLADLKGYTPGLWSVKFSPDGRKIITASGDNTAKIWDVVTANLLVSLKGHTDTVYSAQFSPDGKKIVTASRDKTAKIWDATTGNMLADLKRHTLRVTSAQFSPDGTKIVTASDDKTAKIWDASSGLFLADLKGHTAGVWSVQFSTDSKKIVTASRDSTAKIWDVARGDLLVNLKGHRDSLLSAQFSPDGKKVVTASADSTGKIWDAVTGDLIYNLKGHGYVVSSAQFSPDGKKIVTASGDYTAKIWDVATGTLLKDLTGHTFNIRSAQFSSDGTKIITASRDNTAKIWDATTGISLTDLKGHTGDVESGSFSPDEKRIITGAGRTTVSVWDATSAKLLYSFFSLGGTDYLVVDKDGHYDGTEAARKLLYFTCGTEVIALDQLKDRLWVPNLAGRIMNGDSINADKLSDLNVCGLTPHIETIEETGDTYRFQITPGRGGLGETVLSVNGNPTKHYRPDQLIKHGNNYELTIKIDDLIDYFIAGQENPVTVKSYTSANDISSRGVVITTNKATNKNSDPPNLYAVMVGVSDYKGDELDLKFAAKDAQALSSVVATAARKLLNSNNVEHVFIYDLTTNKEHYKFPEKAAIKNTLEEISKKANANDILLIFFAGHGVMEGEKKQFYFLTADASKSSATEAVAEVGISTAELIEWMKPQNIKAQKRILIFDACNSGQAINDIAGKDLAVRNDDKVQQIKAIDKLNEKSGLYILSASASNQSAYEMSRYAQGLLTYSLLRAIKQQPDILEDGKYLSVSRWFNEAEKTVTDLSKENGARQEPQVVTNANFNIGIVDNEVIAGINLPGEKPLFASSNFQNNDEAISDDDLELAKYINQQLNEIASRGIDGSISFVNQTNAPDSWSLAGRYEVKANSISVKVNIKQGKVVKYRFEVTGNKNNIKELAQKIVEQATEWILKNK